MTEEAAQFAIAVALWPEDVALARSLLKRYGQYLASSPSGIAGVCIPGYAAELEGLPGKYQEKNADLLLARVGGLGAGCVAISKRALAGNVEAAEMKRLWVEPNFRGLGLGRALVMSSIAWARAHACRAVVLDTVAEAMPEASRLYQSLGFEEVERFNDNPVLGVQFYKLMLR